MGTLHYREERVLKIGLKDQNRNDLDCLLIRDALYISMKDVETGNLLGEKGITYDDYKWYPIRSYAMLSFCGTEKFAEQTSYSANTM